MFKLDEDILRTYFRLEEYQRQRLWMERLWHPELMKWVKRGAPPPITPTKRIRQEELAKMGFDENYYQRMLEGENACHRELKELVELHPLWPHFERMPGFSYYLCGAFIAAGGDIQRAPTGSAFWKGMGLDVLPDGTAPRRIKGKTKNVERRIPALPHVTRVGEQIRPQLVRSNPFGYRLYLVHKKDYLTRYPEKPLMFAHKHGQRIPQKILYFCLWREARLAYGLPAPDPYAFDILKHDDGSMIRISDFYEQKKKKASQHVGATELAGEPE